MVIRFLSLIRGKACLKGELQTGESHSKSHGVHVDVPRLGSRLAGGQDFGLGFDRVLRVGVPENGDVDGDLKKRC